MKWNKKWWYYNIAQWENPYFGTYATIYDMDFLTELRCNTIVS